MLSISGASEYSFEAMSSDKRKTVAVPPLPLACYLTLGKSFKCSQLLKGDIFSDSRGLSECGGGR